MILFPLFNAKKRFYKQCVEELNKKSWYLQIQIGMQMAVANEASKQVHMVQNDLDNLLSEKQSRKEKIEAGDADKNKEEKRALDKQIKETEESLNAKKGYAMESDNKIKILNLSKMEAENEKMYIMRKMIKGQA